MNKFKEISKNFNLEHLDKMRDMLIEIVRDIDTTYKTQDIIIAYEHYADQTYIHITNLIEQFYYLITWYKSGEIGCVLFQGEIIDKGDFEDFYKFLRKEYGKWVLKEYILKK